MSRPNLPVAKSLFLLFAFWTGADATAQVANCSAGALACDTTSSSQAGAESIGADLSRLTITIPRIDRAPKLEEFLAMRPALSAPLMARVSGFVQRDPHDGAPAQQKTEVYIGYDARNFYAVFICFDDRPDRVRARMSHREDLGPDHDEVQLYLDTFNDKRRAFGFTTNPLGVQYDFIWTETLGNDPSWDTVWDSKGKVTAEGYVALMSIPFKSLRFPATPEQTWGILFERIVPHDNDDSFFPRVSIGIQGRLNQESELLGLAGISPGRNLQLNPYGVAGSFRRLDERNPNSPFFSSNHLGGDAGLDGKLIVKDSLVLDFTVNPDFRQLESDQPQNTVNQRFEVFFPEKRPFFQEGANFFDTPVNMYFTRRIVDPQFGARLTGKLGHYGIGLLAIDDQSPGRIVPDNDPLRRKRAYFTVGRVTRELWRQSQVGVFYSDRELSASPNTVCGATPFTSSEAMACVSRSNRVGGGDFTFHFGNNFQVQGQALTSVTDKVKDQHRAGNLLALFAEYSGRHLEYSLNLRDVSSGFRTLMGFFQQPDIRRETNFVSYLFRPQSRHITSWGPHLLQRTTFDHTGNRLDVLVEPGFDLHLKENANLSFYAGHWREQLRPQDYSALTQNVDFNKGGYWGVVYDSTYFKWMTIKGDYFNGKNINFDPPDNQAPFLANETQADLNLTFHPLNALAVTNSYILEWLRRQGGPEMSIVDSHIIRSKLAYQYSKELSFRAIFQYDGQLANPAFTSLERLKSFNADFLITYLIHPGTAFYLGYNSNLDNLDPASITTHAGLVRGTRFINDGRTVYAKISYLFRF